MNETVLFLVIGAAVILVGLFLWSRMEAKKNVQSRVGLSNLPRDKIYEGMNRPHTKRESGPQELVTTLNSDNALSEAAFQVESVSEPQAADDSKVSLTPSVEATPKPEEPKVEQVPMAPRKTVEPAKPEVKEVLPKQEDLFTQPIETEEKAEEKVQEPVQPSTFPKEGLARFEYDAVTETVGWVQATKAIDGKKMMEMVSNLQKLGLALRIYVRRSDNKRWYQPSAVGRYSELAVILLLANRQGCVNEMDASRFATAIQQIGIALEADSDTEASHEIVKRAQKLYNDVLRLDVQLNFVMASKEPLNPNDVAEAARLAGFTQLNPMRYFLGSVRDISQATIFLTQDDFDRRYLTIALDAPLAAPDSNPLRSLFSASNDLCARLNLQLQDSRDRPINTESAQSINHQLKKYYAEMLKADIEPGSPRARVLFTRD